MTTAVALASLALFVVSFRLAKIVAVALEAIARVQATAAVLADSGKTDDEKERAARDASMILFGNFFLLTARTGLALLPSVILLALAVSAGVTTTEDLMDAFVSLPLIAAAILFFVFDYMIRR